jgi:membrane-bound lytic murein transglycosylase MltF
VLRTCAFSYHRETVSRQNRPERNGALGRRSLLAIVCALWLLTGCGDAEAPGGERGSPLEPAEAPALVPDARRDAVLELGDPELLPFTGDLAEMRERGVVRVLVSPSRTDFFLDHGHIKGLQAELLRELGRFLNADSTRGPRRVRIKYVPVPFSELIPALEAGTGDLVAAFLTETPERRERVRFVPALRERVAEVVVAHRGVDVPSEADGLAGRRVYVLEGSSYAYHLRELNARLRRQGRPPVEIERADPQFGGEDILELVNSGVVDLTVVDDYKAELWARVLPDVEVHDELAIATGRAVGWAVRRDSTELAGALARFTRRARAGTLLGNVLFERYFENVRWIEDPTARSERDKLEQYIALFEKYGARYDLEPLALAAQAYQESRLDHSLRSRRGAIGLMQLLPSTARDPNVGIPDIDDVEKNVHAGAKYLAFVRDRYFSSPEIGPWDRAAFSLAAYNAGPRRIREARNTAGRMGLDRNVWFDNVEVATGRQVGQEPVRYVSNIYMYYVAYRLLHDRAGQRARVATQ